MNRHVVAVTFYAAMIYMTCAIWAFSDPAQRDDMVVSRFAMAAIIGVVIFMAYLLGKIHCLVWMRVSPQSKWRIAMESVVVPGVPVFIIPGIDRAVETMQRSLLAAAGVLFLVLMDLPGAFRNAVKARAGPGFGDRRLYLEYPPKRRMDMLPLDIAYALFLVYFYFRHV